MSSLTLRARFAQSLFAVAACLVLSSRAGAQTVDAINGRPVVIQGRAAITFWTMSPLYAVLASEDKHRLIQKYEIEAPAGIKISVRNVNVKVETYTSYQSNRRTSYDENVVTAEVELTVPDDLPEGTHTVTIRFPGAVEVAKRIKGASPVSALEMRLTVHHFPTERERGRSRWQWPLLFGVVCLLLAVLLGHDLVRPNTEGAEQIGAMMLALLAFYGFVRLFGLGIGHLWSYSDFAAVSAVVGANVLVLGVLLLSFRSRRDLAAWTRVVGAMLGVSLAIGLLSLRIDPTWLAEQYAQVGRQDWISDASTTFLARIQLALPAALPALAIAWVYVLVKSLRERMTSYWSHEEEGGAGPQ